MTLDKKKKASTATNNFWKHTEEEKEGVGEEEEEEVEEDDMAVDIDFVWDRQGDENAALSQATSTSANPDESAIAMDNDSDVVDDADDADDADNADEFIDIKLSFNGDGVNNSLAIPAASSRSLLLIFLSTVSVEKDTLNLDTGVLSLYGYGILYLSSSLYALMIKILL